MDEELLFDDELESEQDDDRVINDWVTERWMFQMASALSKRYGVTIKEGTLWQANVKEKTLYYPPDVFYMRTNDALTLLIHEIGHLKHTDGLTENNCKLLKSHPESTKALVNAMEDLRIDALMEREFEGVKQVTKEYRDYMYYRTYNGAMKYSDTAQKAIDDINIYNGHEVEQNTKSIWGRGYSWLFDKETGTMTKRTTMVTESDDDESEEPKKEPKYAEAKTAEDVVTTSIEMGRDLMKEENSIAEVDDMTDRGVLDNTYSARVFTSVILPAYIELGGLVMLAYDGYLTDDAYSDEYYDKSKIETAKKIADILKKRKVDKLGSTQEVYDLYESEVFPLVKDYLLPFFEQNGKNGGGSDMERNGNIDVPSNRTGIRDMFSAGDDETMDEKRRRHEESDKLVEKLLEKLAKEQGKGYGKKNGNGVSAGDQKELYKLRNSEINYERTRGRIRSDIVKYQRRFAKLLKDRRETKWGGRHRSGKINTRSLYKHRLDERKLFKRMNLKDQRDYAVSVCIDVSGSMFGGEFLQTAGIATIDSSVLMNEVFTKLGIPMSIVAYSSSASVLKPISDDKVDQTQYLSELNSIIDGGTDPVQAFMQSIDDVMSVEKANHRVVVMLTDGSFYNEDIRKMREHVRKIKDKSIHLYGITITDSSQYRTKSLLNLLDGMNNVSKKHHRYVVCDRGKNNVRRDVIEAFTDILVDTLR